MAIRVRLDDDEPIEVQMAPLIDCMFLLLIFFLVATTLKNFVPEVPLNLPASEAAVQVPEEPDTLILSVDREGNLYAGGAAASRAVCFEQIRQARAADRPVRLDADCDARYQSVLEVIEMCHIEGVLNVGLHTLDEKSLKR